MKTIVDTSKTRPSIDTSFFPHSPVAEAVWTSTEANKSNVVWGIEFGKSGREGVNTKSNVAHIRAVYEIPVSMSELLGVSLTMRSKLEYGKNKPFNKKFYHTGNYNFKKTDNFQRDTFSTTVLIRNL